MAQIMTGGILEYEALTTVPMSYNANLFLNNMYTQWQQQMSPMQQTFYNNLGSMYSYMTPDEMLRIQQQTLQKHDDLWRDHMVCVYSTMVHFQNASPVMMPYIMAMPELSQLFAAGQVDGYVSTGFKAVDANKVGMDRYHYRRAIDGLYMEDPTTGDFNAIVMYEDVLDPSDELSRLQQADIQRTWDAARVLLHTQEMDFTSKTGGRLP